MSKRIYRFIDAAQELIDEKNYAEAIPTLESVREKSLSDYERAVVLNMLGYVYYQTNRVPLAIQTYEETLTLPRLPHSMARNILTTISQLHLIEGNYVEAEKSTRQLLKSPGREPPPPASSVILAQALIGQERYEDALEPLLFAINEQRKAGANMRENWLALLSSVYYNLGDFERMRSVLYELVNLNPTKQYMINLASIHGQLGETDKQLALVEALKDDGRLDSESHFMALVNLFLVEQLPYKAAVLLADGMQAGQLKKNERNLQLESQAWYLAGEYEKAVPPLEEAAELSADGELWLRSARLLVALYEWERAELAAQAALDKGGLKNPGDAMILQGMAMANQGKYQEAKKVLRRAAKTEGNKKWARQWLKYISNEQKRLAKNN